jgi:hypothetical protein
VRQATHAEMARQPRFTEGTARHGRPPDVTALRTSWILPDRSPIRRLCVDRTALQAADAREHGQTGTFVSRIRVHVENDSALCGNLRGAIYRRLRRGGLSGFAQGHAVGYPGGLTTIRTPRASPLLRGRIGMFIDGMASHTSDELREHRAALHVENDVDRA